MIKNRKENILLYIGAGIFFCTSIIYLLLHYLYPNVKLSQDRFGDFDNLFFIAISTLIVAPILEEFTFRGIFVKHKIFQFFFYVGSFVLILITKNYYLLLIVVFIFIIFLKRKSYNFQLVFVLSSILFALMHYNVAEFENLFSIVPVFFQFSLSLIFIWIAVNFGLKWSIISHFLVNGVIIIPLLLLLQFPNEKKNTIEINSNKFTWQKTPAFGSSRISYTKKKIQTEKTTLNQLISLFEEKSNTFTVNDSLRYYRYNFELENLNNDNIEKSDFKKILEEAKLIDVQQQ